MLAMRLVVNQEAQPPSAAGGATCCDELGPLVDRANQGDREALGAVLAAVAPAMLRMVRAVMGPAHPDAPDITQEALMALPGALAAFRKESSVRQYARQVALRTALSARRRRQCREKLLQGWQDQQDVKAEPGPQAYHTLLVERRAALLRDLLDELPEEQAQSFAMRVLLDYTLPQVAEATGVALNTVRSRVRLAKEKLRERLEAEPALVDLLREGDS